jgi:hypothetical protein
MNFFITWLFFPKTYSFIQKKNVIQNLNKTVCYCFYAMIAAAIIQIPFIFIDLKQNKDIYLMLIFRIGCLIIVGSTLWLKITKNKLFNKVTLVK